MLDVSARLSALVAFAVAAHGQAAPRSAKTILRDFDRVAMPSMSDGSDPESVRRFRDAIDAGCTRKAELAAELQRCHPDHARLPAVLAIRWAGMTNALGKAAAVAQEVEALLQQQGLRDDVRTQAVLALARARLAVPTCTNEARLEAIEQAMALDGGRDHADFTAACLVDFVEQHVADPTTQRALLETAVRHWPDNAYGGRPARRWLHVLGMLGTPFVDQLPAEKRDWFTVAAADAPEFTVVQVWTGWIANDGVDEQIEALLALRREFGTSVRLLGLLNGDLEDRLPAAQAAGVDWPQTDIRDPEPMTCPFGAPKSRLYFVLDRDLTIAGVVGHAAAVPARLHQLRSAVVR
ncbi:MAG: hypothetical protein JNL08_10185 [Planctomycetes bacterium]|nr:hypothetical protein [Planctomycetota bacterium]